MDLQDFQRLIEVQLSKELLPIYHNVLSDYYIDDEREIAESLVWRTLKQVENKFDLIKKENCTAIDCIDEF